MTIFKGKPTNSGEDVAQQKPLYAVGGKAH
jgi:hypothetical protein